MTYACSGELHCWQLVDMTRTIGAVKVCAISQSDAYGYETEGEAYHRTCLPLVWNGKEAVKYTSGWFS